MNTLESYRHEKPRRVMKRSTTQQTETLVISDFDPNNPPPLTPEQIAEIEALAKMPDSEINFSDIPPASERKPCITIRNPWLTPPTKTKLEAFMIDSDIIYWVLNQAGEKYQEKLNAMLRKAMEDERAARK